MSVHSDRRARLFVAVRPPAPVLNLVEALPRTPQPGVRWTTRDQWHITLRFLGTCSVAAAVEALSRVEPMATMASLGPGVRRLGRAVLMVPVAGLDALAGRVVTGTADIGQPPEDRPFLGHLTLARLRGGGEACRLSHQPIAASWPATAISLVESHLGRGAARYETISELSLPPPAVP